MTDSNQQPPAGQLLPTAGTQITGGPIGAAITNALYKVIAPKEPIAPKKELNMLKGTQAANWDIDPEVFGKDLASGLTAYNKRTEVADSALSSRNKTYNLDKPLVVLQEGKFQGVKLTKEMIDDAINAGKKYNQDPLKILSVMGQESTFSQSGIKSEKRGLDQRSMTSGWNTHEPYVPYKPEQFLADKQVPGISYKDVKGKRVYSIDDLDTVKAALAKRPGLMEQYIKKVNKTPIAEENYIDMAARYISKKGLAGYNSKDKNYVKDIDTSKAILQKNAILMQYLKSKGVR